jgi:hypothetical protein
VDETVVWNRHDEKKQAARVAALRTSAVEAREEGWQELLRVEGLLQTLEAPLAASPKMQ